MQNPEDSDFPRENTDEDKVFEAGAGITRREFLISGTAAATLTMLPLGASGQTPTVEPKMQQPTLANVTFTVNGKSHELKLDTRTTLLDALREHLHLTGTKKGCDHGQCGACTVIVDGRRIISCLTLAVMHEGANITSIEGLGTPDNLHPLQAAFIKCDGYQCGYCTPGQICSAVGMIKELKNGVPSHVTADLMAKPQLTEAELRERMSGNLCRCGAYSNIAEAITEVVGSKI